MSLFSEIEKSIERSFRRWTERAFGPAQSDELILVHRAVLEEIETQIQTVSRGKRVFPYSRVKVTFASPDANRRVLYQAAYGERLAGEIRMVLEEAGCEVPRSFSVEVDTAESGETASRLGENARPFTIEFGIRQAVPAAESGPARLIVVRGKAEQNEYTLAGPRVNIGRLAELTDAEQRVIRRNDVVFEEGGDEANATVSRGHAHIRLEDDQYRIADDGSEYGTRIFRDGRSIEVLAGNRRGEKLRNGDEIYLGRACLRFQQEDGPAQ